MHAGPLRRGHREAQMPAPVAAEATQQQGEHRPLEAHRRKVTDIAGEAALADAEPRCAHEQDNMAPGHSTDHR